ncbi:hypothetical protein PR202_gb24351 [Eleusine coracana subsp. coracana]|uniref:Cobalamin-independent methionine synthase MetE C-terminal/archaeal domain-containing protein n=1 Tax=Eleusine coracana subsp. coracana TaxID=191504 RepID=A0AAV5FIG8_ELECO|nr:hypothetical protein PR202_gb24351 [Eleusine coracana subsp. coracana]
MGCNVVISSVSASVILVIPGFNRAVYTLWRNDVVEYFAEQLSDFAFTANGWVQSYRSRCLKPPIIYGEVSCPNPVTVFWSKTAQSMTSCSMKGMLTGPVTILNLSFGMTSQGLRLGNKIALVIKKVEDLDTAGIQIHTHMCYYIFNNVIHSIIKMDADMITSENSWSDEKLLSISTRKYAEVKASLTNMVSAAKLIRTQLASTKVAVACGDAQQPGDMEWVEFVCWVTSFLRQGQPSALLETKARNGCRRHPRPRRELCSDGGESRERFWICCGILSKGLEALVLGLERGISGTGGIRSCREPEAGMSAATAVVGGADESGGSATEPGGVEPGSCCAKFSRSSEFRLHIRGGCLGTDQSYLHGALKALVEHEARIVMSSALLWLPLLSQQLKASMELIHVMVVTNVEALDGEMVTVVMAGVGHAEAMKMDVDVVVDAKSEMVEKDAKAAAAAQSMGVDEGAHRYGWEGHEVVVVAYVMEALNKLEAAVAVEAGVMKALKN